MAPLWRDVLNQHASAPIHVMCGGGDQLYNDALFKVHDRTTSKVLRSGFTHAALQLLGLVCKSIVWTQLNIGR